VPVDAPEALAWREGRLVYDREPLSSVVNEVNRYASRHIVITDPQVAALAFSGTVFTNATDDWLASVTALFHLQAIRTLDKVVISADKNKSGSSSDPQT